MLLFLLGCGPDLLTRPWPDAAPLLPGAPADTAAPADTGATEEPEPPGTTGGTATAPETTDTGSTDPGTGGSGVPTEVCYPGAAYDWSACEAVLPWSAGWGSDYDFPTGCEASYGGQYAPPARYVDLAAADPDLPLAPNFVLSEFMQEWKGRYGVYQPHAVERMQELRDLVGGPIYVNSGYRSPGYNASIDGASCSRHMYGDAADFWSNDATLSELADLCDALGAGYSDTYTSHVHCDWRDDPLDAAFYDARRARPGPGWPRLSARIERDARGVFTAPAEGFDEGEPLRTWRAWSPEGVLLVEAHGAAFAPPPGAVRVEVDVGRHVHLAWQADGGTAP